MAEIVLFNNGIDSNPSADEEWRPVEGYPDYEVSSLGRVRSLKGLKFVINTRASPRILKPSLAKRTGYLCIDLYNDGRHQVMNVHVLVAIAFLGPRPDGFDCCHENSTRTDNRAVNLRWDTRKNNQHDAIRIGTHMSMHVKGEAHGHHKVTEAQVVEIRKRRASGETYRQISRDYPIQWKAIADICTRKNWPHVV